MQYIYSQMGTGVNTYKQGMQKKNNMEKNEQAATVISHHQKKCYVMGKKTQKESDIESEQIKMLDKESVC